MKSIVQNLALATALATLTLTPGAAVAQPAAQTPLDQPIQQSGSVDPSHSGSCGFLPTTPVQTLQVNEDFASLDIKVTGDSGITLYIEGSNGFMECFTTDNLSGSTIDAPGLLNRGNYSLFIGNNNPVATSYNLTVHQN